MSDRRDEGMFPLGMLIQLGLLHGGLRGTDPACVNGYAPAVRRSERYLEAGSCPLKM